MKRISCHFRWPNIRIKTTGCVIQQADEKSYVGFMYSGWQQPTYVDADVSNPHMYKHTYNWLLRSQGFILAEITAKSFKRTGMLML
jgi:hypothetical protein